VLLKKLAGVASISVALTGCAGVSQRDAMTGFWAVDMVRTSKAPLPKNSNNLPKICGALGISFLPIMQTVEIEGDTLSLDFVGGAPQQRVLFERMAGDGKRMFFRGVVDTEREVELIPVSRGVTQFRWNGDTIGMNDVVWSKGSKEEFNRKWKDMSSMIKDRFAIVSELCKY
jgi:hypothetical protein